MTDRLRKWRITRVLAAALGFIAGFATRSELQRRRGRGRLLLPDDPHRYAPDRQWPGSCWCTKPENAPVHQTRISAGNGAGR
jgi:hypothetical protein